MGAEEFYTLLVKNKVNFATGVPCSYLGEFLEYLDQHKDIKHIRATSEGEAVGIASGYHLSTGLTPLIYMQNSGLGNAVNPLTSLMDKKVYSIPALLLISWRGEPGTQDEPQHKKIGEIMNEFLTNLGIPHGFASTKISESQATLDRLLTISRKEQCPVALIIKKNVFDKDSDKPSLSKNEQYMKREEIIDILVDKVGDLPVITTTGKTSRELFELREIKGQSHSHDFLTVGSMGCASGIALGVAKGCHKKIVLIDGDGAVLMKMGTIATIGHYKPNNLIHFIIDNNSYESTGAQPSVSESINWELLFKSVGYRSVRLIVTRDQLIALDISKLELPSAIVIRSKAGSRSNLGRPTSSPIQNKKAFMKYLSSIDQT